MLLTKVAEVKWNGRSKEHYEELGYKFTKFGDIFHVPVSHLSKGSFIELEIQCDYCNEIFYSPYVRYKKLKDREIVKKDACKKCSVKKQIETSIVRYGNRSLKYTNAEIEEMFRKSGLIIINPEEYENSYTPIKCICPKHPDKIIETTLGAITSNKRGCKYCSFERRKATYKEVVKEFEDRGLILLETNYINSSQKLKFKCKDHPDTIQFKTFKSLVRQIKGCVYCRADNQKGEKSVNWKGGHTPISLYLRNELSNWKEESMKACNFRCVITGNYFDVIHHLYSFNMIIDELFKELNIESKLKLNEYTQEELNLIKEKCVELHYKYGLGVCLTKEVHDKFHEIYGYGNNTPEQFGEYKLNYYKYKGDEAC